ncbi:serine/threonine-protein kinase [Enhygromyxa salina]|uniref:Serine/threonine-protein kinase PknB n=1 Tax=Enhygromyxa salina TaxID=215803 RepID=A0A2S9XV61_9BACT|nr:serine/threonine-protein kinase [Enhygromyxa salina]PRP96724.1 Serine/threonine-protein kinase PknB [Enhygromyxa salina]
MSPRSFQADDLASSLELDGSEHVDEPDQLIAGRFEILRRLGHGAFAVVYEAMDRDLDRRVALKLFTSFAPNELATALREARAMARLNHHNVLAVHDVGRHGDTPFLAIEYAETDLQRWLSAAPRDADEILRLFSEAGTGLAAAHAAGLVHHDFKPANVMLRADRSVAVGDFGLARHLDTLDSLAPLAPEGPVGDGLGVVDSGLALGDAKVAVGTLRYIAPERLLGRSGDDRSDQFSFCVALWEALAAQPPFAGADAQRRYDSIAAGPAGTPRGRAHVVRALRRGLAVEPEDRFETMDALLWALAPANSGKFGVLSAEAPVGSWLRRSVRPSVTAAMLGAVFLAAVGLSREAPALDVVITPTAVLTANAAIDHARELIEAGEFAQTVPVLMTAMPVVRETDTEAQREYLAQIEALGDQLVSADAPTQASLFYAAGLNLAQDLGADPTSLTDKRATAMAKYRRRQRDAERP